VLASIPQGWREVSYIPRQIPRPDHRSFAMQVRIVASFTDCREQFRLNPHSSRICWGQTQLVSRTDPVAATLSPEPPSAACHEPIQHNPSRDQSTSRLKGGVVLKPHVWIPQAGLISGLGLHSQDLATVASLQVMNRFLNFGRLRRPFEIPSSVNSTVLKGGKRI
jgi:hypothetical protein